MAVASKTKTRPRPRQGGLAAGSCELDRRLVLEFVDRFLEVTDEGTRLAGVLLSEYHKRLVLRWRRGALTPTLWTLDGLLTRCHMHVNEFFDYCDQRGESGWAAGKPPSWHEQEWSEEDPDWDEWRDPGQEEV